MNPTLPFPPPPWRQYLDALPEADLPPALWPRLAAARQQQLRRRQRPLWFGAAAAAVLLMLLAVRSGPGSAPPTPLAEPVVRLATAPADPGLRRLDDQIALAYARGAADGEVAVLWQARAQLIASLDGPAPVVLARM